MYGSFLFVPFSFDPVLIYTSTYSAIFPRGTIDRFGAKLRSVHWYVYIRMYVTLCFLSIVSKSRNKVEVRN